MKLHKSSQSIDKTVIKNRCCGMPATDKVKRTNIRDSVLILLESGCVLFGVKTRIGKEESKGNICNGKEWGSICWSRDPKRSCAGSAERLNE